MTGYGRRDADEAGGQCTVEVRSLNNRYLDVQIKLPRSLSFLEPRVKKAVQDRFSRGRFDVFISRNGDQDGSTRLVFNDALADQYIGVLRDLKARHGLSGDVDVPTIAAFPGIVTAAEVRDDPESVWPFLSTGLTQALDELDRMRREEGALLVRDIRERLSTIERTMLAIRTQAPVTVGNARKRMTEALARILDEQPDPVRLAQEIAILAERTDVTEELTRLGSHLAQFRALLDSDAREGVGRKLDFLLQEMGREVNTVASKAMDAGIAMDVVNAKAELEKIREQVQNIE